MIALQCLLVVLTAAGGNGNVVDDGNLLSLYVNLIARNEKYILNKM
jgi:hypothetical protein